jgi:ribosomal protein S18 acetylase RimI-like enzyme
MSISFSIRRMAAGEAEAVAALMARTIAVLDFYSERARAAETAIYTAAYLRELVAEDPDGVLVADAGGPAGFCVSRYDDDLIWLSWFGVAPELRGRGAGAALLDAMHAARRAAGVHKVWCDSRTDNHASRAALARAGYREIVTIPDHWYRQDYVLLERYL